MRTDKLGVSSGASMSAGTQKHTKGPWAWHGPYSAGAYKVCYSEGASHVYISDQDTNAEANAYLIASAPELLEFAALVARMKTVEEFGDGDDAPEQDDWIETLGELIASARPLVAKATGATRETP